MKRKWKERDKTLKKEWQQSDTDLEATDNPAVVQSSI